MAVIRRLNQHRYFTVHHSKNDRVNIVFTVENKEQIYSALKKSGYGYAKIDEKKIFFLKNTDGVRYVTFFELVRSFGEYLISADLSGVNISNSILFNKYHHQRPLKNNASLRSALSGTLTLEEMQQLRKEIKKSGI